jgi:hypothetical protein
VKLKLENANLREHILKYEADNRIIALEDKLRDQKRIIVNNISDNIATLKNGFKDPQLLVKKE